MIKYGFGAFLTHASTVCTMQRTASFCTRYGIAPRARDHVAAAFIGTPNTVNQRYPTLRHVARKNGCRQTKCIAIGRWSFLGWRENVVVVTTQLLCQHLYTNNQRSFHSTTRCGPSRGVGVKSGVNSRTNAQCGSCDRRSHFVSMHTMHASPPHTAHHTQRNAKHRTNQTTTIKTSHTDGEMER